MRDGFLGYQTSLMLDVVVCALALIVPILLYSVWLVKFRRKYALHRRLQIGLGLVLLAAVAAFEVDMRLRGGWLKIVNRVEGSPRLAGDELIFVERLLWVHLVFAITTPFLWTITIVLATKRFGNPPGPGPHSPLHKKLAWLSTIDITLTSVTGLAFYYFAFIA